MSFQKPWRRPITDEEYAVAVGLREPEPEILRVVIDKEILGSFKGRALQKYPLEYGEDLWGFIEGNTAYITSIERVLVNEADENGVDFDSSGEYGETVAGQTLLGTIHTHPDDQGSPSDSDIESAREPPVEKVMMICAINKIGKRRYVSFGCFQPDGKQIELAISEKDKGK